MKRSDLVRRVVRLAIWDGLLPDEIDRELGQERGTARGVLEGRAGRAAAGRERETRRRIFAAGITPGPLVRFLLALAQDANAEDVIREGRRRRLLADGCSGRKRSVDDREALEARFRSEHVLSPGEEWT